MGDYFVYILKSSACLAFFYLFYRLLLSRETFHRFNRIALMGLIVFSVAVPFIRVITEEPVVIQRPMLDLENLLQMAQMQTEVAPSGQSWLPLLFMVYLLGGDILFYPFPLFYNMYLPDHQERREATTSGGYTGGDAGACQPVQLDGIYCYLGKGQGRKRAGNTDTRDGAYPCPSLH